MNRNIIHTLWMAAALPLLLVSCQQEELPGMNGASDTTPLSITVTDGGYASTEKAVTRAVENGYRTEFTAGDECGLYIVRDGAIVYDNVKLTATAGTNGSLTWQPEASVTLAGGFPDESYFLYYPYQANMSDKTSVSATDADGFFAPLVSGWQPATDQSTYAAYTASDLMTATGTAVRTNGSISLSFSMTHRMAMAVIEMPKTVYKFNDNSIPDYVIATTADFGDNAKLCRMADGTYRCIVNPASSTATRITGSYADGKKAFVITLSNIAAGSYRTYKVDGATQSEKQATLQVGDYFCKGSDNNWYIIPQEAGPDGNVIGIVFHVGQHESDESDYSGTGIGEAKCHGYVVALTDATSDYCMWGVYGKELGCCPTDGDGNKLNNYSNPDIDWNGYAWTQKIITAAGGKDNLNASNQAGYPATYYAVVAYETGCNAPTNSSGWFLPSIGQMWNVYQNRASLFEGKTVVSGLKSDWYWSSSEFCDLPASGALYVSVSGGNVYNYSKDDRNSYVRPVLAF